VTSDKNRGIRDAWMFCVVVGILVGMAVGCALLALAGCASSASEQVARDEAVVSAVNGAGLTIARWRVQRDGCPELDVCRDATDTSPACTTAVELCVQRSSASLGAWVAAWDRAAAVYDAYATASDRGVPGPSWVMVREAYCAAVAVTPEGAPRGLVVPGVCP